MGSTKEFFAHGKLLITGEYAVLDGAKAFAIPTKLGQRLLVSPNRLDTLHWKSYDVNDEIWFECEINARFQTIQTSSPEKSERLIGLLKKTIDLNPNFKSVMFNSSAITKLEFDRNWGLGSSSTLIHLIGQWAKVDPYKLLEKSFKGSGYDIACANSLGPIIYQLKDDKPQVENILFQPKFLENIFFIYMGKKQFRDKEIIKYSSLKIDREHFSKKITAITEHLSLIHI